MLVEDYIDRWKIWRFAILIVVFFFFYPGKNLHASPDNRYFYHLGVEDGLLQSSIFDISEDRYGYIWIATRHGLSRYNGKNFKNYRKAKIEGEYEIIGSVSNIVPCENGLWFNSSTWFES